MKLKNLFFVVAIFGASLMFSCTPEGVEDGNTEQQIDPKTVRPPVHG